MNFAAMFGICMMCHGELVRLRPHPKYLTAYFLTIAAGGRNRWSGGNVNSAAGVHYFF